MTLTNGELVTVIVAGCAVLIVCLCVAISALVAMLVLEWREDRRYQPRHDAAAWSTLLPPPRTPWDRPHPGYDVMPLTAGEIQVTAILAAVMLAERQRITAAVPQLQPSWVAETMREIERGAGLLWTGTTGMCGRGTGHYTRGCSDRARPWSSKRRT